MRALLIEDDHATAQSIELMLKAEGFNVYTTDLGEEGADLAKIYDYDIILLDLGLPDINGLEVLRRIRVGKVNTPIMICSGCSEIEVKVKTFGGGADDYLTKPFHRDELVARVHAVVRRSKGHAHAVVRVGPITVDLDGKTVSVNDKPVHLTGKEYQMIELLALRLGTTITKEMFLNHLYGGMDEPELKIIDVFICKLRAKLRDAGAVGHLQTVWGRGYKLTEEAGPEVRQRAGTLDSLVGSVLTDLSDGKPHRISNLSTGGGTLNALRAALGRARDMGWVVREGRSQLAAWRITDGGLAERRKRIAFAAAV